MDGLGWKRIVTGAVCAGLSRRTETGREFIARAASSPIDDDALAAVVLLRGTEGEVGALLNVWQHRFGRGLAAFTGRRIKDEVTVIRDQAFGRIEAIKGHCRYPSMGCDVQTGYASASACGPLRRSRHLIQSVTRWVGGLCGRFYQNVLFVIFVTMDRRKTPWVDIRADPRGCDGSVRKELAQPSVSA